MEWAKDQKDIDSLQLGQCIDTQATEAEVDKELAEGQALEVDGTPTLFINGRRIAQTIDWPNLRSIIDYEIEYQKTAKNAGEDCGCELKLDLPGLQQPQTPSLIAGAKSKNALENAIEYQHEKLEAPAPARRLRGLVGGVCRHGDN